MLEMRSTKTSFVIVLHNSEDTIVECLRSLPADAEIILVDNESTDRGISLALEARSDISVLRSVNRGFGAGCNSGAQASTGDVLIFLNPDAMVRPGATEILSGRVREQPFSIIGPAILDPSGNVLHVVRHRTRLRFALLRSLNFARRIVGDRGVVVPSDSPIYVHGGPVDFLQGACLALSAELFGRLQGFDEQFFLYYEEEDLCARASLLGAPSLYEPSAEVVHVWGTSISKIPGLSAFHLGRSQAIFIKKWWSAPKAYGAILGVLAGASLSVAVFKVRLALSPSDSTRRRLDSVTNLIKGLISGAKPHRR